MAILTLCIQLALNLLGASVPEWVPAMREVHTRFQGTPGTFAQFGDSITVSMAFWAPLPYARHHAPPEMERAFQRVHAYMRPECWREWKGPEYGNDGGKTIRWAEEHVDSWLRRLNPEVALISFGTNDLHSLEADEYAQKLRTVVERCLANGTVVILSTIPPRSGFETKAAQFAQIAREIARDYRLPLVDFHAEILRRRPNDWDGSLPKFHAWSGYDVPTLIARDGVHPSHPRAYRDDYSQEALSASGFSLRNYLVLMAYAEVIERVLDPALKEQTMVTTPPALTPPEQPWFPQAPPLPPPPGNVISVETVEQLFEAVRRASPGSTILIQEGHYWLPRYLEIRTDNVTLRGASGRRERVILDGARSQHGELIGITACSGVTIADLTIQNVRWNGFKINSNTNVQRVTIYNCIIHNVWQRGVKGVRVPPEEREKTRPTHCRVQYCLFYNDHPKRFEDDPADTPENFDGNYIGGIDVMYPKRWVISDNVFLGIQGRTRSGRGAIFLWHEAEDCVVERNIIIDCDTGIAIGNSYRPPDVPVHATRVLVRNNFITRCPESGIVADYTRDCALVHNTIHDPGNRLKRLIRLVHTNARLLVANNLLSGPPMRIETSSTMILHGNVTQDATEAFVDPTHGDLHLKPDAPDALAHAARMPEAPEDIDRQARNHPTDVGADER